MPAGPDSDVAAKLFLVVFEDAPAPGPQLAETAAVLDAGGEPSENTAAVDARVATLKQELRAKEEYLQVGAIGNVSRRRQISKPRLDMCPVRLGSLGAECGNTVCIRSKQDLAPNLLVLEARYLDGLQRCLTKMCIRTRRTFPYTNAS